MDFVRVYRVKEFQFKAAETEPEEEEKRLLTSFSLPDGENSQPETPVVNVPHRVASLPARMSTG